MRFHATQIHFQKNDNNKFDKYSNNFIKLNDISVNFGNEFIITHDEILFREFSKFNIES